MTLLLLMRFLHIVLGVFWAGTMVFTALFLLPSIRDAGPDGAKVGLALAKRRFMEIMPIVALVTILSGLWLYWRVSGGFQPAFMHSATGTTLGLGAASAIVAFVIGVTVVRPSMIRAAALGQSVAQAAPADRDALLAQAQALRLRAGAAGRLVALFLALTVTAMALARYL